MAITSQTHTSTGGTTYAITFPYLSTSDIRVTLDGVATTAFIVNNSNQVVLNSAPSNGVVINIFRETDDSESKLVFSTGSSIKAADLNNAFKQSLYLNQEFAQLADDESPELGGDLDLNGNFLRGIVRVKANSNSQGQIRLYCQDDSTHFAAIKAPTHNDFTGDLTFKIPSSYGTNGQVLASDGSGGTSWVTRASLSDLSVTGSAGLSYNNSNGVFTYTAPDLTSYIQTSALSTALGNASITDLSDVNSTKVSQWDTAYSWGNHASAGYLTSFTEADPIFTAHPSYGITSTLINNWNTAYSWGNHASAGYLTSFTVTATDLNSISINALSDVNYTGATVGSVLKWNGSQWTAQQDSVGGGGGSSELLDDTTPQLGGDLDMNSKFISSGVLGVKNTGSRSQLQLFCESSNAHYVALQAPAHNDFSGNITFTLPATDGTANQVLKTDGNGNLGWVAQSSGGGGLTRAQATAISLIFS